MQRYPIAIALALAIQLSAALPGRAEEAIRNLALNRAAYTPGAADYINTGHMATDGHEDTRWRSRAGFRRGDEQPWIYVDLGAECTIHKIVLKWEALYAWIHPTKRAKGWNNCFALPRVLTLGDDGQPVQAPVPELAKLRGEHVGVKDLTGTKVLDIKGDTIEIHAVFEDVEKGNSGLKVRRSDDGCPRHVPARGRPRHPGLQRRVCHGRCVAHETHLVKSGTNR